MMHVWTDMSSAAASAVCEPATSEPAPVGLPTTEEGGEQLCVELIYYYGKKDKLKLMNKDHSEIKTHSLYLFQNDLNGLKSI